MVKKWNLPDLANFEALVSTADVREDDQKAILETLSGFKGKEESQQRQKGLRVWFERAKPRSKEAGEEVGNRLRVTLGIVQGLALIISFALGVALIGGLIEKVGLTEGKAYNVWKLIAITIGGQWVFLILAVLSWVILRNNSRKMTLFEEVGGQIIKKMSGKQAARGWNELYRAGSSYRAILSWRVARIAQWAAVSFNLGLIIGFLAILLFLEINFFWATTLQDIGLPQLEKVKNFLSIPWGWWQPEWLPNRDQLVLTQLQLNELNPDGKPEFWFPFLLGSFLFWGLLPRLILAGYCHVMEGRSIGKLTFMEKRHRDLWRKLTPRVNTRTNYEVSQDGVILIDVGGTDATTEELRPFLLQHLRVNPMGRFTSGIVNGDEKEKALQELEKAKRGVVLLVESWNLSPKQLKVLHEKLRSVIGTNHLILYLVLGLPKGGVTQAPEEAEIAEWESFVTELHDPETEIVAYKI